MYKVIKRKETNFDGSESDKSLDHLHSAEKMAHVGTEIPKRVDALIVEINKTSEIKINREWLAKRLNVTVSDLNACLRPDALMKQHGSLANKAVKVLEVQLSKVGKK